MKTKIDRKCRLQTINYLPPKNPPPSAHHQKVPQEQVLLFQSAATSYMVVIYVPQCGINGQKMDPVQKLPRRGYIGWT